MGRRFSGAVERFELAAGLFHENVVVMTRDASKITRFSFQAPSSSDFYKNANRATETGVGHFPNAAFRLQGTLATADTAPDVHWTTIDHIEVTVTSDQRDFIFSTQDVLSLKGPYNFLRFTITYRPATSQDVPTLLIMEESEQGH